MTTKSHVLQWGDLSFEQETIGTFEAQMEKQPKMSFWDSLITQAGDIVRDVLDLDQDKQQKDYFSVDSRDVQLH